MEFSYLAKNLVSASQQPEVVDVTLAKECELRQILGPLKILSYQIFAHQD